MMILRIMIKFGELVRFLQTSRKELQSREKCNYVPLSSKKEFTSASSTQQAKHHPTVATLYTGDDKVTTGKFVCIYCKGNHSSNKCNIILLLTEWEVSAGIYCPQPFHH